MGRTPAEARETIRLSLGHGTSEADVDAAVDAFRQALAVLDAGSAVRPLQPQPASAGGAP
jgi:cysteine sulfinate desulfinase/cysteine desulfurase-like protein